MKKRIGILLLLSFFFFPSFVSAKEGIENFYIDATILKDGSIEVEEAFTLNGTYNGFERILVFKNSLLSEFDGSTSSFKGSSIYNGDGIIIEEVGSISIPSNYDRTILNEEKDFFEEVNYASKGTYGVYEKSSSYNKTSLLIYNPSSYKKAFYIKYKIENLAVLHNDYGELYWNLFSNELTEYVNHLELYLHLEDNGETPRVWAHGPLNGLTKIIDNQTLYLEIDDLESGTAVDIRTLFDKEVISGSIKTSNVEALDKVLEVEKSRANEANRKRTFKKVLWYGSAVLNIGYLIAMGIYTYLMYKKYDKEYEPEFKGEYFRDFPSENTPETVGYLFNKKITTNELSAALLNLISEKVISFETLDKKDYKLTYKPEQRTLSESDETLIAWLFGKIGENNEVTLKQIQKSAKTNYDSFLTSYRKWESQVFKVAKEKNFFEKNTGKKAFYGFCGFFGMIICFVTMGLSNMMILPFISLFAGMAIMIYSASISRRTKEGNNEYVKWKGLRNFLNDFGSFEAKELPEVQLWEKYLVYATVFGVAKKLSKQMEIKLQEMPDYAVSNYHFDRDYVFGMTSFSRSMTDSINQSVTSARSSYNAAHSSYSSGSGGGGGFSSGGGFGGGGGGGGRF